MYPNVMPFQPVAEAPVRLTKREVEILSLIREGRVSKEVADLLFVSKRTVDFHLSSIYEKLDVHNRMAAVHRASQLDLLSP